MQIFTTEFVNAVKEKLDGLTEDDSVTREKLCKQLNIAETFIPAITLVLTMPEFSAFESVRSRGIRRKKVLQAA